MIADESSETHEDDMLRLALKLPSVLHSRILPPTLPTLLQLSLYLYSSGPPASSISLTTALFLAYQFLSGHTHSSSPHRIPILPPPGHSRIWSRKVFATSVAFCNVRLGISDLIVHHTSPQCPFSTTPSAGAIIGRLMAMASQCRKPQGLRGTDLARILILDSTGPN